MCLHLQDSGQMHTRALTVNFYQSERGARIWPGGPRVSRVWTRRLAPPGSLKTTHCTLPPCTAPVWRTPNVHYKHCPNAHTRHNIRGARRLNCAHLRSASIFVQLITNNQSKFDQRAFGV